MTELAQNPLLLTLLAKIAVDDDRLPPSRVKLYARAVRLLLKRGHGRDERGVSDVFAAEEILAPLSLRLHASGEDAWSEEEVNGTLRALLTENARVREALDACRQTPMQFLDEVATRSGLLGAYRGPGEPWRYMHRSLREFLATSTSTQHPSRCARASRRTGRMRGSTCTPRRSRRGRRSVGRTARAVVPPLVERQEPRPLVVEAGAEAHLIVHRDVSHAAAELEQLCAQATDGSWLKLGLPGAESCSSILNDALGVHQ